MNFQNKVAVITGSTTGIGEAVAEQLHQHGAKVVIVSRSPEQAIQKAKQLFSVITDFKAHQAGTDQYFIYHFFVGPRRPFTRAFRGTRKLSPARQAAVIPPAPSTAPRRAPADRR